MATKHSYEKETSKKNILRSWFDVFMDIFKQIKVTNAPWYGKLFGFIIWPLIVLYMFIVSLIQLILYPIFYVITVIMLDDELANVMKYHVKKVWSKEYWI